MIENNVKLALVLDLLRTRPVATPIKEILKDAEAVIKFVSKETGVESAESN